MGEAAIGGVRTGRLVAFAFTLNHPDPIAVPAVRPASARVSEIRKPSKMTPALLSLSKPQWISVPLASPSSICRFGRSTWLSVDRNTYSLCSLAHWISAARLRASMGLLVM